MTVIFKEDGVIRIVESENVNIFNKKGEKNDILINFSFIDVQGDKRLYEIGFEDTDGYLKTLLHYAKSEHSIDLRQFEIVYAEYKDHFTGSIKTIIDKHKKDLVEARYYK